VLGQLGLKTVRIETLCGIKGQRRGVARPGVEVFARRADRAHDGAPGAELLFQVVSDRAEKAALMITTNLPFSEWTQVFTNARLAKACSTG